MSRRSTKGWDKENDYRYRYRDGPFEARVVHSNRTNNWVGQVVWTTWQGDYALKSSSFDTKTDARDYILDYIDAHPEMEMECPECGETDDLAVGGKSAGGNKKKTWWSCQSCGYEAPGRHTIQG